MSEGARRGIASWTKSCWLLFCVVLPIVHGGSAWAVRDWNRVDDPMQGAVGLHLGEIGGYGLAYRYPAVWWLYFQAAGAIWNTEDNKRHNVGLMLMYLLRQDSRLRIYTGGGAGYFYHKERQGENPDGSTRWTTSTHWNYGFGVGVEWLQGGRLSFQVDGNFTYQGDSEDIIFLPQVGVFYYF